jgi:hypothetical protein
VQGAQQAGRDAALVGHRDPQPAQAGAGADPDAARGVPGRVGHQVGQGGASPARAAPPTPDFGPAIDAYAAWDLQDTCDPTAKPGVTGLRDIRNAAYGTHTSYIALACGGESGNEHYEGRALDYRLNAANANDRAVADDILSWLMATDRHGNQHANARRLGIMYILWNRQRWSAYRAADGWQPCCSQPSDDPHTDHIHISFSWAGARKQTTWWTGA